MGTSVFELALVVAIALLFDFTNGFHDAANAIATSVATRSISPRLAVIGAGIAELRRRVPLAERREDHRQRDHRPAAITMDTILAGLVGAITWNLITWWRGLPTSLSHALIGAVAGAAIATTHGFDVVNWDGPPGQVIEPSIYVPLLGFGFAAVLALLLAGRIGRYLDARPTPLRGLQLVSAGLRCAHARHERRAEDDGRDRPRAGGRRRARDVHRRQLGIFAAAVAIALGTYVGGWRIVNTVGRRLSDLDLRAGVAAQTSAAFLLWRAADFGFPISTTQVITGAVLGSGSKCAGVARAGRWPGMSRSPG